jgi:hypothetical protein
MADRRLERLREVAERLEQMPPSPERDRVLAEVRGRVVDLDTGFTPQPMRPVEPDPAESPDPPDRPAPPARVTPRKPERTAPRDAVPPEPRQPPPDADDDPLAAAADLLSLDDASPPADPDDPDAGGAWRKGLRG